MQAFRHAVATQSPERCANSWITRHAVMAVPKLSPLHLPDDGAQFKFKLSCTKLASCSEPGLCLGAVMNIYIYIWYPPYADLSHVHTAIAGSAPVRNADRACFHMGRLGLRGTFYCYKILTSLCF